MLLVPSLSSSSSSSSTSSPTNTSSSLTSGGFEDSKMRLSDDGLLGEANKTTSTYLLVQQNTCPNEATNRDSTSSEDKTTSKFLKGFLGLLKLLFEKFTEILNHFIETKLYLNSFNNNFSIIFSENNLKSISKCNKILR